MRTAQDNHGRGRRVSAPAAVVALAVGGVGLLGFGLSQQESRTPPAPALANGQHDHGGGEKWDQPPLDALTATPSPTSSGATTKAPSKGAAYATPRGELMDRSIPTKVRIPALKVSASMIDLGLQANNTMEVPQDGTSAGWYDKSPTPGELGPSVIAAHVTWDKKPAVFFELGALKKGEKIEVDRKDGTTAVFEVSDVGQYPKKDFPTDKVYGSTDRAALRLITCGGVFNGETGHHVDNVVVYANLVGEK